MGPIPKEETRLANRGFLLTCALSIISRLHSISTCNSTNLTIVGERGVEARLWALRPLLPIPPITAFQRLPNVHDPIPVLSAPSLFANTLLPVPPIPSRHFPFSSFLAFSRLYSHGLFQHCRLYSIPDKPQQRVGRIEAYLCSRALLFGYRNQPTAHHHIHITSPSCATTINLRDPCPSWASECDWYLPDSTRSASTIPTKSYHL